MPRRQIYPGGIYHIYTRGNNKSTIYKNPLDKKVLYGIIRKTLRSNKSDLLYFVFMDNHYHFLIKANDDQLSKAMQSINLKYSKYYNQRYKRVGALYESRFKSKPVNDRRYIMQLIHYMAHNPVKANLVEFPEIYPWSAHIEFTRFKGQHEGICNLKELLGIISSSEKTALDLYMKLIQKNKIDDIPVENLEEAIQEERIAQIEKLFIEYTRDPILYKYIQEKNQTKIIVDLKNRFAQYASDAGFDKKTINAFLK